MASTHYCADAGAANSCKKHAGLTIRYMLTKSIHVQCQVHRMMATHYCAAKTKNLTRAS